MRRTSLARRIRRTTFRRWTICLQRWITSRCLYGILCILDRKHVEFTPFWCNFNRLQKLLMEQAVRVLVLTMRTLAVGNVEVQAKMVVAGGLMVVEDAKRRYSG